MNSQSCGVYYVTRYDGGGLNAYVLRCAGKRYVLFGTYLSAPGSFGQGYGYIFYKHPDICREDPGATPEKLFERGVFDLVA